MIMIQGGDRMNINKFTKNAIEAINNCQKLANEYGNPQIDCEHLLYALTELDDSLLLKLIRKMDIDPEEFKGSVMALIQKKNYWRFLQKMLF